MTDTVSLGYRMKGYEKQQQHLDSNLPAVVRLDGHGFSKYVSLQTPTCVPSSHLFRFTKAAFPSSTFDDRFHNTMVSTCFEILRSYPDISYAYTQSDEITLIFPQGAKEFNGRTDRLLSLTAAKASVRFNSHLRAEGLAQEHLDIAYCDARVFNVPSQAELLNAILWRARTDCIRNSVDKYARKYFGAKQLNGVSTQEKVEKMRVEKGVVYADEAPAWVQFGTSIRKEQYEHIGVDPRTGQEEKTMRMRPRAEDLEMKDFSGESLRTIVRKYW